MSKRNIDEFLADDAVDNTAKTSHKHVKFDDVVKKHTLDSDEEDDDRDKYNILDDNDIEGEEDSLPTQAQRDGDIQLTAFNMNEEMQMGHFDRDGHFIWNNEKEVRDNWLDNVDWQRVSIANNAKITPEDGDIHMEGDEKGLGDASDEDDEDIDKFNEIQSYTKIFAFLKPGESVNKALKRLGGDVAKLSSIERLRRKKAGLLGNSQEVTQLTELANGILTNLGNMDIYSETYEQIQLKLKNHEKKTQSKAHIVEAELDMYSDDFDSKEKKIKGEEPQDTPTTSAANQNEEAQLMWEFKWDQHKDDIEGPYDTCQMNKWAGEGHFKTGVWVRKCGATDANFYSSNRIDFELYL